MSKLLYAGLRRYAKSKMLWISLIATVAVSVLAGHQARKLYLNDTYILAELIIMGIFLTLIIGREYEEGVIRNRIIAGYTKGGIFISELILGVAFCGMLFLIFSMIFACFNSYIFFVVPANVLLRIFFDFLFVNIALAAVFVVISNIISHRAISIIINILLAIVLLMFSSVLCDSLNQPQYLVESEYEYKDVYDEQGNFLHTEGTPIPGTEKQIENEQYLGGWQRAAAKTINCVLPTGHIVKNMEILDINWGYDYYEKFDDPQLTYETSQSAHFEITKENNRTLTINLIVSPFVAVFVSAWGYMIFRKKEFK